MSTTEKKALKGSLKAAQRAQAEALRHGTPETYEAATAVVADLLTRLRG